MELCLYLYETDERVRKGRSNESIICMHERNCSQDEHMGLWKIVVLLLARKLKAYFSKSNKFVSL